MSQAEYPEIPGLTYQRDLGTGGFASVYLYRRETPDRLVAIKVLHTTNLDDEQIQRLKDEANAMAALNHPNIAQIYSVGTTSDNRPYIEMAFYPYGTLEDKLHSGTERRAPFSIADTLKIGVQLCAAIQTAHELTPALLHRDIKPANVLIDAYGNPVLTDFGIASRLTGLDEQDTNLSAYWAPPEAMFSTAPIDQRSDIYSLGALLWNLLTGHPPYFSSGDNGIEAVMKRTRDMPLLPINRVDVPTSLERLLTQSMSKDPELRPVSATEFAHALTTIERHEYGLAHTTPFKVKSGVDAEIPQATAGIRDDRTQLRNQIRTADEDSEASPNEKVRQKRKRNKLVIALIVMAAVIALVLIIFIVLRFSPDSNPSTSPTTAGSVTGTHHSSTPSSPPVAPEVVVKEFLQAIADGDGDSARNLLTPSLPGIGALKQSYMNYITNEVMAKSLQLNPITNITVTPPQNIESSAATVAASYDIGSQHVDTTYDVTLTGGSYHVNGLTSFDFQNIFSNGLTLTLNGTQLAEKDIHLVVLFPGTYQLGTTNPLLTTSNDTFIVTGPSDPRPSFSPEYALTDTAPALFADAVKRAFDACLAEKALETSCGWGLTSLSNGAVANESTIKWTVSGGNRDFSTKKYAVTDKPAIASADIKVTVRMDCKDTKGRSWHASVTLPSVEVDYSDPNDIQVVFSGIVL